MQISDLSFHWMVSLTKFVFCLIWVVLLINKNYLKACCKIILVLTFNRTIWLIHITTGVSKVTLRSYLLLYCLRGFLLNLSMLLLTNKVQSNLNKTSTVGTTQKWSFWTGGRLINKIWSFLAAS